MALVVIVVPVELAGLLAERELVRAVAERLVLRQAALAQPLLLAIDDVRLGLHQSTLHDSCHVFDPLVTYWMTRSPPAFLPLDGLILRRRPIDASRRHHERPRGLAAHRSPGQP